MSSQTARQSSGRAAFQTVSGAACQHVRASLSNYLDSAVTGVEMRHIADHLEGCNACQAEFDLARAMQQTLSTLGPPRVPSDLSLRLRLAISREGRRSWPNRLDRLTLSWQNALRPLVMQAAAGLACAILLLGSILFLLGAMSAANPVMANDEPLGAMTAPHYRYSVAGIQPIATPEDSTIIVEAMVNARGEVYDFRIVSGPFDSEDGNAGDEVRTQVRNQVMDRLLTSVFTPASVFGVPIRGRVIMTFSGISVHG